MFKLALFIQHALIEGAKTGKTCVVLNLDEGKLALYYQEGKELVKSNIDVTVFDPMYLFSIPARGIINDAVKYYVVGIKPVHSWGQVWMSWYFVPQTIVLSTLST